MCKIRLIILVSLLLLFSTITYGKSRFSCPIAVLIMDEQGDILAIRMHNDPELAYFIEGCVQGKAGVSMPCLSHIIILDNERFTTACTVKELTSES